MIGIDLFSGAGGMSLGAISAGLRVVYSVETDANACITYRSNHKTVNVLNRRIEAISHSDFKALPRKSELIVFGGPPCQGFSTSNQRTRNLDNPRNWLFQHYVRVVNILRPDWVIFENVPGILQTERGYFLHEVRAKLADAGYSTIQWVLNAADFGVPQRRSRLFLIGQRSGKPPVSPTPKKIFVTVGESISDLPVLLNGAAKSVMPYRHAPDSPYSRHMRGRLRQSANHLVTKNASHILKRYTYIPQGGNWENIPDRLMQNYSNRKRCHEWIYRRLRNEDPSVVIGNYRKNMLIHPTQDRGLSVREAARLQSFPDWFEFHGSIGFQQQQVGNAVPPLLAEAVFRAVLNI